jgi:hypothetical protein
VGLRGAAAINADLNTMEKEGILHRILQTGSPVLWELASRAKSSSSPKAISIKKHVSRTTQSSSQNTSSSSSFSSFSPQTVPHVKTEAERRSLIFGYLSQSQEPSKALTIAKNVGLDRHEVNSLLYKCEREGSVTSVRGTGSPLWKLSQKPNEQSATSHESVVVRKIGRGSERLSKIMSRAEKVPGGLGSSNFTPKKVIE